MKINLFICYFLLLSCGHQVLGSSYTATDTIPPVIEIAARDTIYECDISTNFMAKLTSWHTSNGGMVASDEESEVIIYSAIPNLEDALIELATSTGCIRSITVDFFATDDCGNTSEASSATFSVEDREGPIIIVQAQAQSVSCGQNARDSLLDWTANQGFAEAADVCANSFWNQFTYQDNLGNAGFGFLGFDTIPIPDGVCEWSVDVSFIVEDACGNQNISTSSFEIVDDIPPFLSFFPTDTTVSCEDIPLENNITGVDFCTLTPIVDYNEEIIRDGGPEDCSFYNYSILRTWITTDNCGNSLEHTQTVTIQDISPPQFFLVDTVEVNCNELENPESDFIPTNVIDNCSEVLVSFVDSIIGEGCEYTIQRVYTFTDICGNADSARQLIFVKDQLPPVITNPANDLFLACESRMLLSFESWLNDMGNISAEEECGSLFSFAAVPGSYDINDPFTFPGEHPGDLDEDLCGENEQGFIILEEVDFVYYDDCNNVVVERGRFGVVDDGAPVIESCPQDTILEILSNSCFVTYTLPEIVVLDNCSESDTLVIRNVSQPIVSSVPGDDNVIVNFLRISFGPYVPFNLNIIGDASLDINIENADIDGISEFFYILNENLDTIGITSSSTTECGSSTVQLTIPSDDIISMVNDGEVNFLLRPAEPNIGSDGINDICTNSVVNGTLEFPNDISGSFNTSVTVDGVDLLESEIINNSISLNSGTHEILYIAKDCANNSDTCMYSVTVLDGGIPDIQCMADTTFIIDETGCMKSINLPLQYVVNDNCALSKIYETQVPNTDQASLINFSFDTISNEYYADNISVTFENTFLINHTSLDATLEIFISADLGDLGESIEIKGEDGSVIGSLGGTSNASCKLIRGEFTISKEKINSWALDNKIDISFIPSRNDTIEGGGINPCQSIENPGPDNTSFLKAKLRYSDAEISYAVSGATIIQSTLPEIVDSLSLSLNAGINTITLTSLDLGGNATSCSFDVIILDTIAPIARCENAVAFLNPSGVDDLILDPSLINNGSSDNCNIDSLEVSPSTFSCSQLGEEVEVTLTVFDQAGNSSICSSIVMLRTMVLEPSFELGICDNDSLTLIANAPPSNVPDVYTFSWTGPNNFSSIIENPVIPNASPIDNGTYILEITGFGGCISSGTIEVNVEEITSPEITSAIDQICSGDELLLTAAGQTGNIMYNWFEGQFPNGLLLESTEAPSLVITPSEGDHFYYIVVTKDGCESNPSPAKLITVVDAPEVSVLDEFITVCRSDNVTLGTDITGDNITYQWTGPNGYNSDQQFPDTIFNASESNEGLYSLVIHLGSCSSDTASLQVTLFEKPIPPVIDAGDVFCEGTTISLSVNNIPNADSYTWFRNGEQFSTTIRNTLVLNNASIDQSGSWTVVVSEGICESIESQSKDISIESQLLISASNNGPGCEGDSIQLNASFVPGATYSWLGPNEYVSSLQSPIIQAIPGEYFVSIITPSGCDGDASTIVEVVPPPEITALSSDALECMDGNTDINFFPSIFPQGDYTYQWTGPGDYTSSEINAAIPNATIINNGTYSLVVLNGSCASIPAEIEIDITTSPDPPTIEGFTQYCVDDTLQLTASSDVIGAEYIWNTPLGQRFTEGADLIVPFIEQVDQGLYSAVVQIGNCRSSDSDPIQVDIGNLPFTPSVAGNALVCPGDSLALTSSTIQNVMYQWSGPNGFNSTEQNPVILNFSEENVGSYSVAVNSNGCEETSNVINIALAESPPTPVPAETVYFLCESEINNSIEVCIDNISGQAGFTYSVFNASNDNLLTEGNSVCLLIDDLSGFQVGSNFIYFRSYGGSCSSLQSSSVRIEISEVPLLDAEVETNPVFVCDDSPITITSLFGPPQVDVSWSRIDANLILNSNEGKSISVSGISKGENRLILTYSTESCLEFSSDTVLIVLDDAPSATNDDYQLNSTGEVLLSVFDNDFVPATAEINIINPPSFGTVDIQENGILYIPDTRFVGTTSFTYEICGLACNGLCVQATVQIIIGDPSDCKAPTIFTPNGDGVNDEFVVPCLYSGNYIDSNLSVFNQWGNVVFSTDNYDNTWAGTYNGKDLPVGTYYYILDLGTGEEPIIGFLILER